MKLATMGAGALVLACAGAGCGSRSNYWSQSLTAQSYGLANGVALVDGNANRVVIVSANPDESVSEQQVTIGHNVSTVATSVDGTKLYVMSTGDWPPQSARDQLPELTVVDVSTRGSPVVRTYPMQQPLSNLVIDPLGQWAVAYAGSGASGQPTAFVENPNEIVLFNPNLPYTPPPATPGADAGATCDTAATPANPVTRDIQSFGGTPQQLTFTPQLFLPNGTDTTGAEVGANTRLLLIESTVDLTLLDMTYAFEPPCAQRPEITVQLTDGTSTQQETPAGVVVDDGDPADPNDARIALWTSTDSNVFVFKLIASQPGTPNPFTPSINSAPVGQIPSAVAFVHTSPLPANDNGLEVLALVPLLKSAVFIDDSDETTQVLLPAAYTNLSLVTNVVGSSGVSGGPDVALLWQESASGSTSGGASGVAFWGLEDTSAEGIDVVSVSQPIQAVLDVGRAGVSANPQLKVLELADSGLYVLNLTARTASPLETSGAPSLTIAADGMRMWAYATGGYNLAEIQLPGLNLVPLTTTLPIGNVYDVTMASADAGVGAPSALIATHPAGGWGATVFNANTPSIANASNATSLLVEPSP